MPTAVYVGETSGFNKSITRHLSPEVEDKCGDLETSTSPPEDIDEKVYDVFEEFQLSLSGKEILHPSEECHRQEWQAVDSQFFDVINSYHIFCRICKKHFYTRSVPTDINSFFQAHLNTSYHREFREWPLSRFKEMITWEEKWKTGKCNVCQMSGLVAFVRDMDCSLMKLFGSHICFSMTIMQKNNQAFLSKMSLLKLFCKLSIFKEKFIKPLDKGSACLLCCSKIPWTGENVKIHLGSESHFGHFCCLVRKHHYLAPKDLLNGFNLEMVVKWIYCSTLKFPEKLHSDYENNERECFILSSDTVASDISLKSGHYCPKEIDKLLSYQPSDFTQQDICLLCNKTISVYHFKSELHRVKAENLCAGSFDDLKHYQAFCANREDRLRQYAETIEKYKNLKEGSNFLSYKVEANNDKVEDLRIIFLKKMALVKKPPIVFLNKGFECHVCDRYVFPNSMVSHFSDYRHIYFSKKWQELEKWSADNRFFEPFQKAGKYFFCLICGVSLKNSNIFFHLKNTQHTKKFEWYCSLQNEVPISSAIEVLSRRSIVCYLCDSFLLTRITNPSNLRVIQQHWPCPAVTGQVEEATLNKNNGIRRTCLTCRGKRGAHKNDCPTNLLDFRGVEKATQGIIDVYEGAMFKTVFNKAKSAVRNIEARNQNEGEEAACEWGKSTSQCECENVNGVLTEKKLIEEKLEKIEESNLKNDKGTDEKTKSGETQEKVGQEFLVLSGLQKSQKKFELISKLRVFGKIEELQHRTGYTTVRFAERGVAAKIAAGVNLFPKNYPPIKMTAVMSTGRDEEKPIFPPMDAGLLMLMEQQIELVKFVTNLTATVTAASESAAELEREKLVCTTINNAVGKLFPLSRCYPFGSRLSGLMFGGSDLDVFLDCGGMYDGTQNMETKIIQSLAAALRKTQEVTRLRIIDKARVPIISFLHKLTGVQCDLSFKNALSIHNTLLIKFFVSLNHQVKSVVVFLKYWVKQNGLHKPPFFSSYAITMMVIFYLQQLNPPLVPTVEELQKTYKGQRLTIGGWNCSFSANSEDFSKRDGIFPLQVILRGFFRYYANFDYVKNVISPLDGKLLPREAFFSDSPVKLPMSYKRHILNFQLPLEQLVSQKIPICVIDPFDLSHVITKCFTPNGLEMFKYYCEVSAKALENSALNLSSPTA